MLYNYPQILELLKRQLASEQAFSAKLHEIRQKVQRSILAEVLNHMIGTVHQLFINSLQKNDRDTATRYLAITRIISDNLHSIASRHTGAQQYTVNLHAHLAKMALDLSISRNQVSFASRRATFAKLCRQ
jgi:uncharacterized protein YaaW (UPF0174 family)